MDRKDAQKIFVYRICPVYKKFLEIVKTPLKTKELGFHFLQQIGDQFKDGLLILNNLLFYECGASSFPQQSKKIVVKLS